MTTDVDRWQQQLREDNKEKRNEETLDEIRLIEKEAKGEEKSDLD